MLSYHHLNTTFQLTAILLDPDHPFVLKKIGDDLDQKHLVEAYEDAVKNKPKYGVKLSGGKGDIRFALLWSLKTKEKFDPAGINACLKKLYAIKGLKSVSVVLSEDAIPTNSKFGFGELCTWYTDNIESLNNGIKTFMSVHEKPATIPISSSEDKSEITKSEETVKSSKKTKTSTKTKEDIAKNVEEVKPSKSAKAKKSVKKEDITESVEKVKPSTKSEIVKKEEITESVEKVIANEEITESVKEEVIAETSSVVHNPNDQFSFKAILDELAEIKKLIQPKKDMGVSAGEDSDYEWFFRSLNGTGLLIDAEKVNGNYKLFYDTLISTGYFNTEYVSDVQRSKATLKKVKEIKKESSSKRTNKKSDDDIPLEDTSSPKDVKSDDIPLEVASSSSEDAGSSDEVPNASNEEKNWKNTTLVEYVLETPIESYEEFFDQAIEGGIIDEPSRFLLEESKEHTILPPLEFVFNALQMCPLDNVKVVLLGQDPYPTEGAAMGMSFSHFPDRKKIQPSLKKIYKCLEFDKDAEGNNYTADWNSGDLSLWAVEGVLLLNTALTVRAGVACSHASQAKNKPGPWTHFIEAFLRHLSAKKDHLVVFLWGEKAGAYKTFFDSKKHYIIEAPHPAASAYSPSKEAEFVEHRPFSRANTQLVKWGIEPIDWNLA